MRAEAHKTVVVQTEHIWLNLFLWSPLKGLLVHKTHPGLLRDITKNWAGFNFPVTQTIVILIVLYSYSKIKWGKKTKKYNALGGRTDSMEIETGC